jgi:hypothetical protein
MNEMQKIKKRIWWGLVLIISIFGVLAILGYFFVTLLFRK